MYFQYDNETNKATADRLYYPADKESSVEVYKNAELADNKNFKFDKVDAKIKKQLDKSLEEMDVTYEEFSDWCTNMVAKKDFSKYLKDDLTGKDYLDYLFGYDLEVKDINTMGVLIKDKKYCILVSDEFVYAFPRTYDFIKSTGYMFMPEANAGGYYQKQPISIYNFTTNEVIKGEMTQEDISEVTGIRDWYYEVLKKYNVTTAGLMK